MKPKLLLFYLMPLIFSMKGSDKTEKVKKFSYMVASSPATSGHALIGTGFYLSYHSKVYLASAWHVFTNVNPVTRKALPGLSTRPRRLRASIMENDKPQFRYHDLYFANIQSFFPYGVPSYDMALLPVIADDSMHILDWDDNWLIDTAQVNDSIFFYGYPSRKDGIVKRTSDPFFGRILSLPSSKEPDIVINVRSFMGCSGAPVFKVHAGAPILIGVVRGGDSAENTTVVVPLTKAWPSFHL